MVMKETVKEPAVVHSTFVIEKSYPVLPAKVFAAFADATKKQRWFGGSDHHKVDEFSQDFRPGGKEVLRYTMGEETPLPGVELRNEGQYLDIIPDARIVTSSAMTIGGKRISASLVTVELLATPTGTDLICTNQSAFFEGSDGPKMREGGWRSLFDKLAKELEEQ
jgi:uncharacterized protein YndB with AHSA1/START domain